MKITDKDVIKELERTVRLRQKFYPSQIAAGRLNKHIAERQIKCLQVALSVIKSETRAPAADDPIGLFS